MKVDITKTETFDAKFLQVNANVRYWDDAIINGEQNESGENVPFKFDGIWRPQIDIDNGTVVDWPIGVVAQFHFKVCDAGWYELLDENKNVIATKNGYVPSGLCHGGGGYGDYIIFNVGVDGKIENYQADLDCNDWGGEE